MQTNRVRGHSVADPHRADVARAFAAFGHQTGRYLAIRERHRAVLTEVEQTRCLERARGATPRWRPHPVAARRAVGAALVRTGECLQGVRRVEPMDAALREGLS